MDIEQQLILRVPDPEVAERLRHLIRYSPGNHLSIMAQGSVPVWLPEGEICSRIVIS